MSVLIINHWVMITRQQASVCEHFPLANDNWESDSQDVAPGYTSLSSPYGEPRSTGAPLISSMAHREKETRETETRGGPVGDSRTRELSVSLSVCLPGRFAAEPSSDWDFICVQSRHSSSRPDRWPPQAPGQWNMATISPGHSSMMIKSIRTFYAMIKRPVRSAADREN